jgi:hypothetical protein
MRITTNVCAAHATQGLRIRLCIVRLTIATVSIGLVFTLQGCAATSGSPPYPTEWASIKSAPSYDGCPSLQGAYSNQVSAAFPPEAGTPPSLSEIFTKLALGRGPNSPAAWNQSWPIIPRDTSMVSIDQTPESITVTFVDSSGNRTPLNFRRYRFNLAEKRVDDLFMCRTLYGEPSLRFFAEPESHSSSSFILMEGGGTFVVMLKAVDGSLVVNWRNDSASMTLLILGTGYRVDNLWYRYPLLVSVKPVQR